MKPSLKWKLVASLILAMALPMAATGIAFTRFQADIMEAQIISANESLSLSFIDQIEAYLDTAQADLTTLKTMIEKQDFRMLHHTSLLDSTRVNKPYFTKIQIINREGYVRFVSPHDPLQVNLDFSRNPVFTEPSRTGTAFWSTAFIDTDTGQVAVALSIPFENGVISGFLSLEHLSLAATRIARGKDIRITITDQNATYIAHYQAAMVSQRGFDPDYQRINQTFDGKLIFETRTVEGESMFITASMIPKTDWAIVFFQPAQSVFRPIRLFYLYMASVLAFLILVTAFLSVRHINLVIATLDRFTQYARGIAKGSYQKEQVPVQYREFSLLSDQFSAMARSIQTRETALKENEEKYRSIFIAAKDAIILADEKTGQILDANDSALSLYQFDRETFLCLTVFDISADPGPIRSGLETKVAWIPHARQKKRDGSLFSVELSLAFHQRGKAHTICTLVARDITLRLAQEKEREEMQKALGQAQKMEAVGRLAGGIAHDFNNILAAIMGFAEMSQDKAPQGSDLAQYNAHVLKAAHRARDLVEQILTFARPSKGKKQPIQVPGILKEVVKFMRATIPTSIEIRTEIASDQWVMADPIQLHQVVMNLCTNAWHAMGKTGGTLLISLHPLLEAREIAARVFEAKKTVCLTVKDTGKGIDPEILPKIFDPYFTTKPLGEGTGMGLSVVQGIIMDMEGRIEVETFPGKGSTFKVYLPAFESTPPEASPGEQPVLGGRESILLVDDEPEIARAMGLMLESLGYTVERATNPLEALSVFRQNPDRFDLVISDMTMPGMGGDELTRRILAIRPQMAIIICTGFHHEMTSDMEKTMGIRKLLAKPVEKKVLAQSVREALQSPSVRT